MSDVAEDVYPVQALENYIINTTSDMNFNWDLEWSGLNIGSTDGTFLADDVMQNWRALEAEGGISDADAAALEPKNRSQDEKKKMAWIRAAVSLVVRDPRIALVEHPFIIIREEESLVEGQAAMLFDWKGSKRGDPKSGPGRLASLVELHVEHTENEGTDEFMYQCHVRISYARWEKYYTRRMLSQSSLMRTPNQ